MAKSDLFLAFNEITETHHLPREIVIEALKQALVSAYKRDTDNQGFVQRIEAEVDPTTSKYRILVEKEVVSDSDPVLNEKTEILLEDARQLDPQAQVGDMVMAPEETNTRSFGRIAAQTAKQVILQRIREAERKSMYDEFKDREGDLVTGTVQSISPQSMTLSLGRAEALLPAVQQIKGERYRTHDKVRTYVMEVKDTSRGPQIIVSRAHKNMLRRLLEYEVPEIYNGQVEIKNIAREAGHRSKVAVAAMQPGVDPVGACVGMRGVRIQNIVKELNDEKIDVIEWNTDASVFIAKALSPAKVSGVYLEEDIDQGNTATVIVPDDQLSLAIGREGQNARLAAKLTGWRIDIKSVTEAAFDADSKLTTPPLDKLADEQQELVIEVQRILDKKRAERIIMPEEYHTLTRFVQLVEHRLLDHRETLRNKRRKAMERARPAVPAFAFEMPLSELELAKDIENAIKHISNVGELMVRLLADEPALQAILQEGNAGDDAMDAIREAIDSLVLARQEIDTQADQAKADSTGPLVEAQPAASLVEPMGDVATQVVETSAPAERVEPDYDTYVPDVVESEDHTQAGRKRDKKAKRGRDRDLVYDERRGEAVPRRKHKRKSNKYDAWSYEDEE